MLFTVSVNIKYLLYYCTISVIFCCIIMCLCIIIMCLLYHYIISGILFVILLYDIYCYIVICCYVVTHL